jgi:hypothetical protein
MYLYLWWMQPCDVIPLHTHVAPPNIKKAVWKMGPMYQYQYNLETKKLYVRKGGNKKWKLLRY